MSIYIYNVLTKKKEEFIPIRKNELKMYACGITTSGDAHIGHAYQAIVFDVIRRFFEYCGYEVRYVRNYTDVDDKIIAKANELKVDPLVYANEQIIKTDEELRLLGNKEAIQPRASENIAEIIEFINNLISKGYAYSTEYGDVYYSVKKFSDYGKLSNRNVDESISGTRKEVEPGKQDDRDFALWKHAKENEIYWDSPWGKGRPGWHIECSTMVLKYLGDTIDIHGGGKDLIFPHHENEIAQSEALTGKPLANYWIHNGLIRINGQKMSKSLGNGITIKQLLDSYHKDVIRFALLKNNYKSDINIIDGDFEQAEEHIYEFYKLLEKLDLLSNNDENEKKCNNDNTKEELKDEILSNKIKEEFYEAMSNDFNTSKVLSLLFTYFDELSNLLKKGNIKEAYTVKNQIVECYSVLGILQDAPSSVVRYIREKYLRKAGISEKEIVEMIEKRIEYKKNKDYKNADLIRNELIGKGLQIKDTKQGTEWDIDFSVIKK